MKPERESAGRLDRRTVIDEARRAGVISRTAAFVAVAMNDYANASGILRGLGYADLAELLVLSKATVYRAVRELCATGLVVRLQRGRGWKRASYAVASNSRRGDLRRIRAASMCSHRRRHTDEILGISASAPSAQPPHRLPLTPAGGFSLTGRDVAEPDRVWQIVEARRVVPEGFDGEGRRKLAHLAAAIARRAGVSPPKLLRWLVTVPPARTLTLVGTAADRLEAARTIREADERDRASALRAVRRSESASARRTSAPARAHTGSETPSGPRPFADAAGELLKGLA